MEEFQRLYGSPPEGPEGEWRPYHNALRTLELWPKGGLKPWDPGGPKPNFAEIERAYLKLLNKPQPRELTVIRAFTARRLAEWWAYNHYRKDTPNLPTDYIDDRLVTDELYPLHRYAGWRNASKLKMWMIIDLDAPWGVELLTDNEKAKELSAKYRNEQQPLPPFDQVGFFSFCSVTEAHAEDDWKIPHAAWHTADRIIRLYNQLAPLVRVVKISKSGKELPMEWPTWPDARHWDEELRSEARQRGLKTEAIEAEVYTILKELVAKVQVEAGGTKVAKVEVQAGGTEVAKVEVQAGGTEVAKVEVQGGSEAQVGGKTVPRPASKRPRDNELVILIALRVQTERGVRTDPNISMAAFVRAFTLLAPNQCGGYTFGQTCWHTEDLDRKNEELRKLGKHQIKNQFYKSANALARHYTSIFMGKPRSFDTGELCWLYDSQAKNWTKRKDNKQSLEFYAVDDESAARVLSALHHY
jgi:hypothetical protein